MFRIRSKNLPQLLLSFLFIFAHNLAWMQEKGNLIEIWEDLESLDDERSSKGIKQLALLERDLLDGEIVSIDKTPHKLGGKHPKWMVTLRSGNRGIFKPFDSNNKHSDIKSEVAAYEFDRMFGFNIVPPTVLRTIENEVGSFQFFVEDALMAQDEKSEGEESNRRGKMLRSFDYLINSGDRSKSNYLFKEGRVIAIDNSYSFKDEQTRKQALFRRNFNNVNSDRLEKYIPRYDVFKKLKIKNTAKDVYFQTLCKKVRLSKDMEQALVSAEQINKLLKRRKNLVDLLVTATRKTSKSEVFPDCDMYDL